MRKRLLILLPVLPYGVFTLVYYQARYLLSGDEALLQGSSALALFFVGSFFVVKLLEAVRDLWAPKPLQVYYHLYSILATYVAMHLLVSYSWYMRLLPFAENYFLHQLLLMGAAQLVCRYFYRLDYQVRQLYKLA
ncbi:MAG: hypothetical protein KF690_07245 [Bacteroidetes bacterium]|nr:hypothetical protein [Bacteroidota bacterium]